MFNKIRSLIPYLVAVSASSPLVEGKTTSYMDNRLVYYRENQSQIPVICHDILPRSWIAWKIMCASTRISTRN